jgi:transposase InsO family protein
LLPTHDAAAAETFLREVVVPPFQRAGWSVRRVLTNGSPEFKSAFDLVCRQLGVRHTTKPRHAWTNAFVERLQGTILEELGRVAFTTRAALHRALAGFMRYYTERPHQRYRLLGRTPAALILGVATP